MDLILYVRGLRTLALFSKLCNCLFTYAWECSCSICHITSWWSQTIHFFYSCITPGGWTACLCLLTMQWLSKSKKTLKYVYKSIPSPSLERLHSLNIVRISHALHSCVMPAVDRCITLGWAHIYHYMFSLSCNWMRSCCSSLYYHAFVWSWKCVNTHSKTELQLNARIHASLCTATEQGQNMHRLWPYSLVHVMYRHKLGGNKIQWLKSSTVQFVWSG